MGCKHSAAVLTELQETYFNDGRVSHGSEHVRIHAQQRASEERRGEQQLSRTGNFESDLQIAIHRSLASSNTSTRLSSFLDKSTLSEKDLSILRVYDYKTPPKSLHKFSKSAKMTSNVNGKRNVSPSFSPTSLFGLLKKGKHKSGSSLDIAALEDGRERDTDADATVFRKAKRSGSEDTVCLDVDNEKEFDENDDIKGEKVKPRPVPPSLHTHTHSLLHQSPLHFRDTAKNTNAFATRTGSRA